MLKNVRTKKIGIGRQERFHFFALFLQNSFLWNTKTRRHEGLRKE